jgi:outer membrane receptor protein involved in Fe transport
MSEAHRSALAAAVFCTLLFGSSAHLLAQTARFTGRIVEASSQTPIGDATVMIAGLTGTSKTDADGIFTLDVAPKPPFQLIVVLSTGQVARPIQISDVQTAIQTIPISLATNESLTVVGAAPSVSAAPAAATSMLSNEQISTRTPENLTQALETVPGVSVVSEGHASVPAIRGLARGRTLVLIDGARVTSERRVGPSATFADPATFEGIDVARGPGSVAYGSDAIGGVISVRTRRAQPGAPLTFRGSATLGGGIPERRTVVEVSKGLDRGGVVVQGHARDAEDWDSPIDDSDVFNSGWEDRGFNARFDYEIGRGVFSAGWQSDFGRNVERPRNNSRTVRFYYPYENSHRLTTSFELPAYRGFQHVTVTGFIGSFEQRTDQDRVATATAGRSIERADVSASDFHVKGSAVRSVGRARVEMGVDVNGRFGLEAIDTIVRFATSGDQIEQIDNLSVDTARRTDTGAYVQAETIFSPLLRMGVGGRGDFVTTKNVGGFFGDRRTSNGSFSGFASLTAGPFDGFSLTGQVSRGFRDPTVSDRYFRGPSGRGFITGNPDLRPETSLQVDLAARYGFSRTQIAAYFYHYRITDLVERFSTEPDFFFFRNQGRARVRGFELEARSDLGSGVELEGGLNISRGTALDSNTPLDDIAPTTLFVLARKTFGRSIFAQVRASLLADDARPGPSEVDAPGAEIVDVSAGWQLTRQLELRGVVRNLLDDAYYASPDPRWVYAAGRSASVTLAVSFAR